MKRDDAQLYVTNHLFRESRQRDFLPHLQAGGSHAHRGVSLLSDGTLPGAHHPCREESVDGHGIGVEPRDSAHETHSQAAARTG